MNVTEFAALLNGRQYGAEITKAEAAQAKAAGLVIVFGASDDLIEMRGAIYDEVDAYGGATAYLTCAGLVKNDCDDDDCPHFKRAKKVAATIKANWATDGYSWTYTTAIPHATFDVMEGDDKYCRGIVFALADVDSAALTAKGADGAA